MIKNMKLIFLRLLTIIILVAMLIGCINDGIVPHLKKWGIYSLDLKSEETLLCLVF